LAGLFAQILHLVFQESFGPAVLPDLAIGMIFAQECVQHQASVFDAVASSEDKSIPSFSTKRPPSHIVRALI
jgi:hypothetical protein